MTKDVVIIGDGKIAEIAYQCFVTDGDRRVIGFAVESDFKVRDEKLGLPVIELERIGMEYPPDFFDLFLAIGYHDCNLVRERIYNESKSIGYDFASYVSAQAWVPSDFLVPENSLIMAHASIQPGAVLGENVSVFSGCVIGHHSEIGSHVWLASGTVIGGSDRVGKCCFFGMNSTLAHEIAVGERCFIGAGTLVTKNLEDRSVVIAKDSETIRLDIDRFLTISKMK